MPEKAYNIETPYPETLGKPTAEEYAKAKAAMQDMSRFIGLSRKLQNELLDKLCAERTTEKIYLDTYERHKEIVRRYEIYEDLEAGKYDS